MPIPPSTWQTNTPVSAGQLNQDMYTYDGSYFSANGVFFHSNRPICQETYGLVTTVGSQPNGQWVQWGGIKGEGFSVIDTSALFGIGCDSPGHGAFFRSSGVTAVGSSGSPGVRGGWVLMVNFLAVSTGSSTVKASTGAGWFINNAASVNDVGCIQPSSSFKSNASFAINLFNVGTATGYYNPGTFMADPNSHQFTAQSNTVNTCGETSRFSQIWCGVNANGSTVSSIPAPQTTFTATTPITSTLLNNTIQQSLQLLNYPPMLNEAGGLSATVTNNSATVAPFVSGNKIIDNYNGMNYTSHFYTVPLSGLYFCHANILLASALTTGNCAAGFFVIPNGSTARTTFFGGNYGVTQNANVQNGCPITRMFDLQAGDQVAAFGYQNSGSSSAFGSMYHSHFIMVWMGALSAPSTSLTWTPPDTSGVLMQAGNPPGTGTGQMVPLFQSKVANDLNFLINKPYFMAQQKTVQTGLSANVFHTVTMDTVGGQVHGSAVFDADNYNGWTTGASNAYVAQQPGWYLVLAEVGITPNASTAGSVMAGIRCPVSGGLTVPTSSNSPPDWYQEMVATQVPGPSAPTALGLYYLLAGESVSPQIQWQPNTGTGTFSTDVTSFNSTFSVVWVSN